MIFFAGRSAIYKYKANPPKNMMHMTNAMTALTLRGKECNLAMSKVPDWDYWVCSNPCSRLIYVVTLFAHLNLLILFNNKIIWNYRRLIIISTTTISIEFIRQIIKLLINSN